MSNKITEKEINEQLEQFRKFMLENNCKGILLFCGSKDLPEGGGFKIVVCKPDEVPDSIAKMAASAYLESDDES